MKAVLLAGGTGLAPLLSILEKLSENPPSAPVHLIYGLTREADIVGLAPRISSAGTVDARSLTFAAAKEKSQPHVERHLT